jgi:nitroreductase
MDALNTILNRRSYRVYQDKPVPDNVVENLLKAGMFAPSAMNSQPWEFLVIRDAEKKAAISEMSQSWSILKNAPLCMIIMANTGGYRSKTTEFFVQDCASSTMCILLAAEAQGLGGVYLGLYPNESEMQNVRELFGIPAHILPFSVVSIGYPHKPLHPHRTFRKHMVHHDEY